MNRGDIYFVDLGPIPGNRKEQAGTRPAIAISLGSMDPKNPMVIVIPLTSNLKSENLPYSLLIKTSQGNNLQTDSVALISQLGALDKRMVKNRVGHLDGHDMGEIERILKDLLRL
ncbi:MAG: type II toxin-antitoxin system PemK/MazF family toxin [Chloroflexota bacterium]|nr:type II toxin-antitoxin system PemK/MazF family toxin [Chloroflexota bacterium]